MNELARVVPDVDRFRQAIPGRVTARADYKEWVHFCVPLPGIAHGYLLLNVSVSERNTPHGPVREARLLTLAHTGAWHGAICGPPSCAAQAAAGSLDVRFGANSVCFRDGAYLISLEQDALRAELHLTPCAWPTLVTSIGLGAGSNLQWVALPRLEASGWVRVGGERMTLQAEPAYHDHNWGQFRWGAGLSWEWGFVQLTCAEQPWTVVLARVAGGAHQRTLAQNALVWVGKDLVHTFQNRMLELRSSGQLRVSAPFTLPRLARLALPDALSGVPSRLELSAVDGPDELHVAFDAASACRIALPSETDDHKLVVLNETCGSARVRAKLGQHRIDAEGEAMMEFVHA